MRTSEKGKQFIALWEGVRLRAYRDAVGKLTIGVGHLITQKESDSGSLSINGRPVRWTFGITRDQADALLSQDLSISESPLDKYTLEQHQFDALVSLIFNIGTGAFSKSTIKRMLDTDSPRSDIAAQFARWVKAGGRILTGLAKRRKAEATLFEHGEYGGRP